MAILGWRSGYENLRLLLYIVWHFAKMKALFVDRRKKLPP